MNTLIVKVIMPKSYTPGLKILEYTSIIKKRLLPLLGKVHVQEKDKVESSTIVASTEIPGNIQMINVANELNIDPDQVISCMLCAINEKVTRGQIIAKSKGLFGFFQSEIKSPSDGFIGNVSDITGQVVISEKPIKIEVDAYIPGFVDTVVLNEGVEIKAKGTFIQGIIGIGGEKKGKLNIVEFKGINNYSEYEGQILVIKGCLEYDHYIKANQAGVSGIVCGGINYTTLTKILGYPLGVAITGMEKVATIVVTEGFGDISMSLKTYNLLNCNINQPVSINGATQIRAGVMRPEIFIGKNDVNNINEQFNEDDLIISLGSKVRIIREPYFGIIGRVIDLPSKLIKMDSETMTRGATIKINDGQEILIPRANLEVILSD